MMKRFCAALLAALVLLSCSACEENAEKANRLTVYYLDTEGYQNGGEFVVPYDYYMEETDDLIHNALNYLSVPPVGTTLKSSLVNGVTIYSYTLNGSNIEVDLSAAYYTLSDIEKTAANCCLVLTLCGIAEVDTVSVYVDGVLAVEQLSQKSLILEDTDTNEFEKQISLYFPEVNNRYLQQEYRVLTIGQDKLLAEYILEELINSTQNTELRPSIPEGTRLLSVEQHGGTCTVELSEEFVLNRAQTAAGQRMAVYSIVNSLTELEDIDRVQLRINGESASGYEYIVLSDTFSRFEELIYGPMDINSTQGTVYLGLPDSDKLVETPIVLERSSEKSAEENILRFFIALQTGGGYVTMIPQSVSINSIETVNRMCHIDITDGLLAGGAAAGRKIAYAMAYSVIDTNNVDRVTISVDGEVFLRDVRKDSNKIIK